MATVTAVAFDSAGARLVGRLFLPAHRDPGPLPGVVVTGSWTTVKEQMPLRYATRLAAPTLIVHSEDAAVPAGAKAFHQQLAGPKQIVWTDGSQLDFYDQQVQVSFAVDAVADHFGATL